MQHGDSVNQTFLLVDVLNEYSPIVRYPRVEKSLSSCYLECKSHSVISELWLGSITLMGRSVVRDQCFDWTTCGLWRSV